MTEKGPASTKSLFRAMKPKGDTAEGMFEDVAKQTKPDPVRDPLDYDPTPEDATTAFIEAEIDHIEKHMTSDDRNISEPAVGNGHMARVFKRFGFDVRAGDLVDRDYAGPFCLGSFYDTEIAPAKVMITNPPYGEINARDGYGRWLQHGLDLGFPYMGMLLNADWAAARIHGFDQLFRENPPSIEYLCCWKIDFRGKGSPPQRNSFFVWDVNRPAIGPDTWVRTRLYRNKPDRAQGVLI